MTIQHKKLILNIRRHNTGTITGLIQNFRDTILMFCSEGFQRDTKFNCRRSVGRYKLVVVKFNNIAAFFGDDIRYPG